MDEERDDLPEPGDNGQDERPILGLDPIWTARSSRSLGRDPLGLQATSVRIYRELVPGLTNVTNRLRYYSFYCWAVRTYEQEVHADSTARWRAFIRRTEALYAMSCLVADPKRTGGMAGREWAEKALPDVLNQPVLDLKGHDVPGKGSYLGAKGGNFGQFYIASMIDVGLLAKSQNVPLIGSNGRVLAKAFAEASGAATKPFTDAIITGEAQVSDLAAIGAAMGPHAIPDGSDEMRLLRGFIEGEGGSRGKARRDSTWLLLDFLRRLDGADFSEDQLRAAFYNRSMPDMTAYDPSSPLLAGWRAYEAGELCHSALAALFNGLMAEATDKASATDKALATDLRPDRLCTEFGRKLAEIVGAGDRNWGDWAMACGTDSAGDEYLLESELGACIDGKPGSGRQRDGLAAALRLLATLWARWGSGDEGVLEFVQRHARAGRPCLAAVMDTLNVDAARPVGEAIASLMTHHLVESHLTIAARKLLSSSLDTYHFTITDNRLCDPLVRGFQRTNPRLGNLLRFAEDASLCMGGRVTAAGQRFLARHAPN